MKRRKCSLTSKLKYKFALLAVGVSIIYYSLEDAAIRHHVDWVEADSDILVLVGFNGEDIRFDIKSEALALALGAGLDGEFHCARYLVRVHDLESFFALSVLTGYKCAKPEDSLQRGKEA